MGAEKLSGITLWIEGTAHSISGLPLHLCNCAWDYEDFPAAALFLNGYEGRRATVPELTPAYLENIANEETTPTVSQKDTSPRSTSQTLLEATISLCGNNEVAQIPVSSTIHREYVDRVRLRRKPILISLSLRTVDDDPAIVLSLPFKAPLHLVLHFDCKPSVALVQANHAFVAPAVITDGAWHQIRWMLDSKSGASLYVDGQLAGWQYHTLPFRCSQGFLTAACEVELQLHRHQSSSNGATTLPLFSIKGFGRHPAGVGTTAMADSAFQEALRRRSFVVSMSNMKKSRVDVRFVVRKATSNSAAMVHLPQVD